MARMKRATRLTERALEETGQVRPIDSTITVRKDTSQELAVVFAKLLSAGCPPAKAIAYLFQDVADEPDICKELAKQWLSDSLVRKAIDHLNGGAWAELSKERRFQLALDQCNAEAAYFLWTTPFGTIEHREGLEKVKMAREMLKAELKQAPDEADPMQAFARFALDYARGVAEANSKKKIAPQAGTYRGAEGPSGHIQ